MKFQLAFAWHYLFKSGILLGLMGILSTCGISPDNSKFIPQNASFVFCVNIANLIDKVDNPQNLINNEFFKSLGNNTALNMDYLVQKIPQSGIDFNSKAYLFGDASDKIENNFYALSFKLSDERAFDVFLRNIPQQKLSIESYAGMRFILLDNKTILGWMNQVGLLITLNNKTSEKKLRERLFKLRDLPEEEALKTTNNQFRLLLSQGTKYDLATWVSLESFSTPVKQFLKRFLILNADLKNNYLTSTTSFEKGEVFMDLKFYNLNKSLAEYKDILKKDISAELVSSIPARNPMAVLGLGLDMSGIQKLYKNLGVEPLLNAFLNVQGLTGSSVPEIIDMMSGDFLGVLEDIKAVKDSTLREPRYETVLGFGIKKRAVLDKILNKFVKDGSLKKEGEVYRSTQSGWYFLEKDKAFYMVSSAPLKELIASGKKTFTNNSFVKLGEHSCIMVYADIRENTRQKFPRSLFRNDRTTEGWVKSAQTPIESIAISNRPPKNDISETRIIFAFKDRQSNALQAILKGQKWF